MVAVIRRSRMRKTIERLGEGGFSAVTSRRVLGRGREGGLKYSRPSGPPRTGVVRMEFLPKQMLSLAVKDAEVGKVVSLLIQANKTGGHGDGKIFVLPMDEAVRVRTGEGGDAALE